MHGIAGEDLDSSIGLPLSYIEEDIMLWDVAAGLALILGAGGSIDLSPGRHKWSYKVYASNNNITKDDV